MVAAASTRRTTKKAGAGAGSRKRRTAPAATTIPELKESFDSLEHAVTGILRSGADQASQVRRFQESWRKIFGRPVDAAAAAAYLQVKARSLPRTGAKTRKAGRGKQHGGAATAAPMSGAPVDFQVRPGVDGTYGSFLSYVSNGFGFGNTVNQPAIFKGCGTENITPAVPISLGSNKVGGGMISDALAAAMSRPIGSSSPPSVLNDIQTSFQGRPLGASPAADQTTLRYL